MKEYKDINKEYKEGFRVLKDSKSSKRIQIIQEGFEEYKDATKTKKKKKTNKPKESAT